MSRNVIFVLVAGLLLGLAALAVAEKPQTICPVGGEAVDKAKGPHLDWQGQRIYFCCDTCKGKFKADPEKYFAKAAAEGVVFENIQTACPVSDEPLGGMGKPVFADHKGRRVMFCCSACKKPFDQDPGKFLAKLPGEQAVTK